MSRDLRQFSIDKHMKARDEAIKRPGSQKLTGMYVTAHEAANSYLPLVDICNRDNAISLKVVFKTGHAVHAGKFLICRSIAPSFVSENAINLLVDDPDGEKTIPIQLYDYNVTVSPNGQMTMNSNYSLEIPVGSIIALMNPWCKILSDSDFALICKTPHHFVILGKHHPITEHFEFKEPLKFPSCEAKNFDELDPKDAGVKYFAARNFLMALECFKKALETSLGDSVALGKQYSNMAACHLALGQLEKALLTAEKGLEIDPKNVKLMFRFAKTLFSLHRFEECAAFLKRCENEVKTVSELRDILNEAERAVRESQFGEYDLFKMYEEASKKCPYLDGHAEFFAKDLIEMRHDPLGLVARRNLEPGTLVIASKAFSYWSPRGAKLDPMTFTSIAKFDICALATIRVSFQPSLFEDELMPLDDGEAFPGVPGAMGDQKPFADSFRISHIVNKRSYMASDFRGREPLSVGLWTWPAMINHTCVDINCVRYVIGAFMFIRTLKPIKRGESLLYSFTPLLLDLKEREMGLDRVYGMTCKCRLCESDRNRSAKNRKESNRILQAFRKSSPHSPEFVPNTVKLLEEARALPPLAGTKFNLLAMELAKNLAISYKKMGRLVEAASLFEEVIEAYDELGLFEEEMDVASGIVGWHPDRLKAQYWLNRLTALFLRVVGDERLLNVKTQV